MIKINSLFQPQTYEEWLEDSLILPNIDIQKCECQFKSGMSWDNYGEWYIDHKKPLSAFNKETPANIVNMLSNLQPLWADENLKKGKKWQKK